ncbi:hypothetical protein CF15_04315 [Pyrodictium occultum]|uniref:Uncharacterized protein n=1 Tax=Pyrodictium occultum TaxID=2309 RepID=A0A0V8RVD9_PYROC|nr:hypothetical protein [Pyrodictium occultum]KSW12014.1 hypothetical protein CF15_04315 [Pyrodictium occultum]
MSYSRLLLALGYLSAPFAGPGSAVLTAAGWLSYGTESRRPLYTGIGMAGLLGVAAVLADYYGSGHGLAEAGGTVLLLYSALSVVALWTLGIRAGSTPLKAAAALLAMSLLLAVSGASSVDAATRAASGGVVDWGGVVWANQAAQGLISRIGGAAALAKLLAAAGAVLASVGFLSLGEAQARGGSEETIFSLGTY